MKQDPEKSGEAVNAHSGAKEKPVPRDMVERLTKKLKEALCAVIESAADERAKIGCLQEAVKRAMEEADSEPFENSPDLLKILLDISKAVWLVERKSLAGYSPDLGNEKVNEEFTSFINSFSNVALRRFLMACGKFRLGEQLTYEMIDAAQKEMSESYTLSMIVNFRYGDFLQGCSPFYFEIKSCSEVSKKSAHKVTVMRLLRRKERKNRLFTADGKPNIRIRERRRIPR
jgi:hypothetical protein